MAFLRIEDQILRFRLQVDELKQLEKEKQIIIHNAMGGFSIFVSEDYGVKVEEGGIYTLFVAPQHIQKLWDISPSKEGVILEQNPMKIHFELDIKKPKKK